MVVVFQKIEKKFTLFFHLQKFFAVDFTKLHVNKMYSTNSS